MVIMIIAFRFQLGGNILFLKLGLDIVVHVDFGFYGFLAATILSLACTHIMIHFHRGIREEKIPFYEEKRPLCYKSKSKKYGVLFILFACIVLLFVGAFIDSFAFVFDGAAGWALGKNA